MVQAVPIVKPSLPGRSGATLGFLEMNADARLNDLILLNADEGRRYEMGGMTAIFKADEAETDSGYAVSEWVLEAGFDGGGPHRHAANDEIFFGNCPGCFPAP